MMILPLQPKFVLGLSAGLAVCVLMAFFYCVTAWHSDWVLAHQAPPIPVVASSDETTAMIKDIPANHLFGMAFSKGNVPITSLQLKVTGIVKVTNESGKEVSKAYISTEGQPSKIYQVGDSLPSGVKIYEITTDTVILEKDGTLEKLPLPRQALEFKPRTSTEHF
jgi:general secretion pathway protein C